MHTVSNGRYCYHVCFPPIHLVEKWNALGVLPCILSTRWKCYILSIMYISVFNLNFRHSLRWLSKISQVSINYDLKFAHTTRRGLHYKLQCEIVNAMELTVLRNFQQNKYSLSFFLSVRF